MAHQECHLHPSFQSKPVYDLRCLHCDALLCARGMKAILLADRSVELYSTDMPPPRLVRSLFVKANQGVDGGGREKCRAKL